MRNSSVLSRPFAAHKTCHSLDIIIAPALKPYVGIISIWTPHAQSNFLVLGAGGQDVRVTGIEDGHGGAAEELTAGGTELNLCRHVSLQLSEVVFRPLLRANPQSIPRVSAYLVVRP